MLEEQLRFVRDNAPRIPPTAAAEEDRPFWSVVIPTHDRWRYIGQTLHSVLQQDPGPERMQIEVMDDASSEGDVQAVVKMIGGDRVGYVRQPHNVGQFRNVNAGIARARGRWIHVLHDDDWVGPGFYEALEASLRRQPSVGAALTAIEIVNAEGRRASGWPRERETPGIIENWLPKIATGARVQTPGVVVRRDVYELLGGFKPEFPWPGDWEMWQRIAAHYDWWYEPGALAHYRDHGSSVSGGAKHSGQNIVEVRQVIDFAQNYLPANLAPWIKQHGLRFWTGFAVRQARRMMIEGDFEGAAAQLRECLITSPDEETVRAVTNLGATLKRATGSPGAGVS